MVELLQANWLLVVLALLIGIAVAWWIFVASRRTRVEIADRDEDGGGAAKRNQALIDAPPAAASAAHQHDGLQPESAASAGPQSAAANSAQTAAAPLGTDAEAGDGKPTRAAMQQVPPVPSQGGDDLSRIKGVGPKLVTLLGELGVTRLAQIAAWDDAEIDRIDAHLGRFQGRIRRDNWVEQARLLSSENLSDYEAKFGRT